MIEQKQCRYCKRFSAMVHDRCPHCHRKSDHNPAFEWLIMISFIGMLVALFKVLLF